MPQISCDYTRQIWKSFIVPNRYFCIIEISLTEKTNEYGFGNPTPALSSVELRVPMAPS